MIASHEYDMKSLKNMLLVTRWEGEDGDRRWREGHRGVDVEVTVNFSSREPLFSPSRLLAGMLSVNEAKHPVEINKSFSVKSLQLSSLCTQNNCILLVQIYFYSVADTPFTQIRLWINRLCRILFKGYRCVHCRDMAHLDFFIYIPWLSHHHHHLLAQRCHAPRARQQSSCWSEFRHRGKAPPLLSYG